MAVDAFEDFLKRKQEQEKKVDWEDRKNKWIKSVNAFYNDVNKWLYPFTEKSLLKIKVDEIMVSEEHIGTYKINKLDIFLGNDIVSLTPKGTLILGSNGRIDMTGPKGEKLLVEPKWNDWKFIIRFGNKRELVDVDKTSFESVIQDLVNG